MTYSVIGHGSYFDGAEDPDDVDVLVVTDEEVSRQDAEGRLASLGVCDNLNLRFDVTVTTPEDLSTFERAIIGHGKLLDGDDLRANLNPLRPLEWCLALLEVSRQKRETLPAEAALAALGCLAASRGDVVVPKSKIVHSTAIEPYERLAATAWKNRNDPNFFDRELGRLFREADWAPAGEAVNHETQGWGSRERGWGSKENQAGILTVYPGLLTDAEIARLAAADAADGRQGGWKKAPIEDGVLTHALRMAAIAFNTYWVHLPYAGIEQPALHRHPVGSTFPAHVDRLPILPTRLANVVAMVQPAEVGGQVYLNLGGELIQPELSPGDVLVFDASVLHGVTEVREGERVVLVTHSYFNRGGTPPAQQPELV